MEEVEDRAEQQAEDCTKQENKQGPLGDMLGVQSALVVHSLKNVRVDVPSEGGEVPAKLG